MVLNINTNLGVAKSANVFASPNNGIVTESELTRVAKEILTAEPAKTSLTLTRSGNLNNVDVKFFDAGYDVTAVKQAATNRTGFNVNLSQDTLNSINVLKAQAAQNQAMNLTRAVDGKIHINSERPDASELKAKFISFNNTDFEVFQAASTDKDRRGPGGFYLPFKDNEDEREEGLNMVI